LDLAGLSSIELDDQRLLWIDLTGDASAMLAEVCAAVGLGHHALHGWNVGTNPALGKQDQLF